MKNRDHKFIVVSEFGELLDLVVWLSLVEGYEAVLCVQDTGYKKIGQGIVTRDDFWQDYLGAGYTWVVDGSENGKFQDWLRAQGEDVFGGSEAGDLLENNRQLNQKLFAAAGFDQPQSENFTSLDDAILFVSENSDRKWILKQNGTAPKSVSYMGKMDDSSDMLFHLRKLKSQWSESSWGPVDFDLMEVVVGTEVAASAFWCGVDFARDPSGLVVGFLNFEEKKECDLGLGETTGEMGTVVLGVDQSDPLFSRIMVNPVIMEWLTNSGLRGFFDINCILCDDGRLVALEPTCRPGIPTSSWVFLEGIASGTGEMIATVASGSSDPVKVNKSTGVIVVVCAKPFPIDDTLPDAATSIGERLWVRDSTSSIVVSGMLPDQLLRYVHPQNFCAAEDDGFGEGYLAVATKNGYLFTVTSGSWDVASARANCLQIIRQSLYLSGMKYRSDIGVRVEDFLARRRTNRMAMGMGT